MTKYLLLYLTANVSPLLCFLNLSQGFMYTDKLTSEFPGEVSSKYTICRSLGRLVCLFTRKTFRGACGEVRIAYERATCAQFAMKIVPKRSISSRYQFSKRELAEAEILKKLNYVSLLFLFLGLITLF